MKRKISKNWTQYSDRVSLGRGRAYRPSSGRGCASWTPKPAAGGGGRGPVLGVGHGCPGTGTRTPVETIKIKLNQKIIMNLINQFLI